MKISIAYGNEDDNLNFQVYSSICLVADSGLISYKKFLDITNSWTKRHEYQVISKNDTLDKKKFFNGTF